MKDKASCYNCSHCGDKHYNGGGYTTWHCDRIDEHFGAYIKDESSYVCDEHVPAKYSKEDINFREVS